MAVAEREPEVLKQINHRTDPVPSKLADENPRYTQVAKGGGE